MTNKKNKEGDVKHTAMLNVILSTENYRLAIDSNDCLALFKYEHDEFGNGYWFPIDDPESQNDPQSVPKEFLMELARDKKE
jgi:hypothetical protein